MMHRRPAESYIRARPAIAGRAIRDADDHRDDAAPQSAVTLSDALALLEVGTRLHRAGDEAALRQAAAAAARDLLPGASVRCDLVTGAVAERATQHEIVRSTAAGGPALTLTVYGTRAC